MPEVVEREVCFAYMFDDKSESGRSKVELSFEYDKVNLKSVTERKSIYYKDLVVERGGSNKKVIFYKSASNDKLIFFSEDIKILESMKAIGGETLNFAIKDFNRDVRKHKSLGLISALTALILLILIPVGLYFSYPFVLASAVKSIPVEVDQKIGDVAYEQYISKSTLIKDEKVLHGINVVMARLKPHIKDYDYPFQVYVIDNSEINAFALPGGYIVVHTGLLLKAESSEELAGVLAHEISHVTKRHSVQRIVSNLGVIIVAEIFIGDISGLLEVVIQGAEVLSMSQFSQKQETEADSAGFLILKDALISPNGFINFFERMQKLKEEKAGDLVEIEKVMEFVSSHPSDDHRIKNIQKMYEENPFESKPVDLDWQEYQNDLKDILIGGKEK